MKNGRMMLAAAILAMALAPGCTMTARNEYKKLKSGLVGLDSHITLYAANGDTISAWHTSANVETSGGEAWWVDDAGVQHHIAGTFIVKGE